MIGKMLGMILVMTASIIIIPLHVAALFRRARKMRGSSYPSDLTTTALCCRCMTEYEAGKHSH